MLPMEISRSIIIIEEEGQPEIEGHFGRRNVLGSYSATSRESSSGGVLDGSSSISFMAGASPRLSRVTLVLRARGGLVAEGEVSIACWLPPVTRAAMATTGGDSKGGFNVAGSKEPCAANALFPLSIKGCRWGSE
jgi:hypothetical protein